MTDGLSDEDIAWIEEYKERVVDAFSSRFDSAADRFADRGRLLTRFAAAVDVLLERGRGYFRAVDEAHNELCIAQALIENIDPCFDHIEYEPTLPKTRKSIDFRAEGGGMTAFIDVKTIKPAPRDRWDQYQRALDEDWFPENVSVLLSGAWLGGELWHNLFAARGRMLEYTIEMERKISEINLTEHTNLFVLVFCGEGLYWHQDELEDFVSFYRAGQHRLDDPFSSAEQRFMADEGISLDRTITRFACMRRSQGEIDFRRLNWDVRPPSFPSLAT